MKKKRTYNVNRIKRDYPYRIEEIAKLLSVHKGTVRVWIRDGLPTTDRRRPTLIYGADLIDFLRKRQSGRKRKCQDHELPCFKCRAPCPALGKMADLTCNGNRAQLTALCAECGTVMYKAVSVRDLQKYRKIFVIQTAEGERITDSP